MQFEHIVDPPSQPPFPLLLLVETQKYVGNSVLTPDSDLRAPPHHLSKIPQGRLLQADYKENKILIWLHRDGQLYFPLLVARSFLTLLSRSGFQQERPLAAEIEAGKVLFVPFPTFLSVLLPPFFFSQFPESLAILLETFTKFLVLPKFFTLSLFSWVSTTLFFCFIWILSRLYPPSFSILFSSLLHIKTIIVLVIIN